VKCSGIGWEPRPAPTAAGGTDGIAEVAGALNRAHVAADLRRETGKWNCGETVRGAELDQMLQRGVALP
jgi:hypothetical protein